MFTSAQWLRADLPGASPCPLFETAFPLPSLPVRATLCATAVGIYQAFVNGDRVGTALYAPGWTSYPHRLQYQTYDVTALLRPGENRLGLQAANGWAVGYLGRGNTQHIFADHIQVLAELRLEFADGSTRVVGTDGSWQVFTDRILSSEFYHGETVDFNCVRVPHGPALPDRPPQAALIPDEGVPVREVVRVSPRALIVTPRGERVLDFGQNLAGYVELRIRGRRGDRVTLSHAEVLDRDGNFYTKNLELAQCRNTYILDGEEQLCKPCFSFQGYRYVRLDEYPFDTVDLSCFVSVAVCSDLTRTGRFVCGDRRINQLYRNTLWGQRSNFIDLPTDCPQRDERLGWLGDAQVFVRTAAINFRVDAFFRKWLNDLMLEQREDGALFGVVPKVPGRGTRISAAWGDAAVICPWELYMAYGNTEDLRRCFPMMKKWVDYVHSQGPAEYLWLGGDHYGDWLAADAKLSPEVRQGATQTDLIASAYFAWSTTLLIRAGEVLGEDMSAYRELLANIRRAFHAAFLRDGLPVLCPGFDAASTNRQVLPVTQTAIVLILHFGLYEGEQERRGLLERLVRMIEENGNRMTTGFVGTPYLLHVLTDHGRADKAYDLFLQEKSPSWLFSVNRGATTVWEHWDGIREDGSFWDDEKNSFNHYSYGSVFDWVYGKCLGITPLAPAYRELLLQPHPDVRLGFMEGSVHTGRGLLSVAWHYTPDGVRYEAELPPDTRATLRLPGQSPVTCGPGSYVWWGNA